MNFKPKNEFDQINKILNLLHPLLQKYYWNMYYECLHMKSRCSKDSKKIEWLIVDEIKDIIHKDYATAQKKLSEITSEKASEHIKKLFPEFEKNNE